MKVLNEASFIEIWVVYRLQGETVWSTVCAHSKQQNRPNGKFRWRLACTIYAIHSNLQRVSK